jgi:hypothetical protein
MHALYEYIHTYTEGKRLELGEVLLLCPRKERDMYAPTEETV